MSRTEIRKKFFSYPEISRWFKEILLYFQDSAVRFIELLQAEHLGLSSNDFLSYMRGEAIEPSRFVPLFDYPLENNSKLEQLRKMAVQSDGIEYHSRKFDENLRDFHKRLTQSVADINESLSNSFTRFPCFEQIPTTDNEQSSEVIQQETKNGS